jgi:peptide/nickel transport system substrate-binding protein
MHSPYATFIESIAGFYNNLGIVPVGYDPKKPVGTGPFKAKSFQPGVQSEFVRNEHYWQHGRPYLDAVVINDLATEAAQVNALLAGQVDVVSLLSFSSIGQVDRGGSKVVVSNSGSITPFTMRVDAAPFKDNRVRQAMRYLVDRRQMIDVVFGGHGTVGNDIFSIWDSDYDHAIPQRPHDPDKAKSLLKAAGQSGLTVELVTSDIAQGTVSAAQVLAQQAKSAGVNVKVRHLTVSDFFGPSYLKWKLAQDYWYYGPYLPQVSQETLPGATFNETHFDDARYNKLYSQATRQLDAKQRREIAHEMQRIDYASGGLIIPYFAPVIDGHSAKVNGVVPSRTGFPLSDFDFASFWLS